MLSKELRELEINLLITRTILDTFPGRTEYALAEYGKSLHDVISHNVLGLGGPSG
jgi:DNA-binding HxlR family transcriptional regulator